MKKRKICIDIVRVCSCFGIVTLHVTVNYMSDTLVLNNSYYWWVSFVVNMFTRISVPLFFVVSGYLNLDKTIELKFVVRKAFYKIITPLLIFGIINILYWNWFFDLSQDITLLFLFKEFISGPMMYHLWFLYAIVALYLISPFLNTIVRNTNQEGLKYFVILWLILSTFSTVAETQNLKVNYYLFEVDLVSGFVPYYLAGGFLKSSKIGLNNIVIAMLSLVLITVNIIYTPIVSATLGDLNPALFDGSSPTIIVATILIFIYVKKYFSNYIPTKFVAGSIDRISASCFGIYLIHPMVMVSVMHFFNKKHLYLKAFPLDMFITIFSVFTLSFLIVVVMRNIPIIKNIL